MTAPARYRSEAPSRESVDSMIGCVLLEFGTAWCGHCRAAQSFVDAALERHAAVRHLAVEDGPGRRLGRSFAVKLWPTLIALRDGREIGRTVRPRDAEAVEALLARLELGA